MTKQDLCLYEFDHSTEEMLMAVNCSLRDEVVSLMLDIAILREANAVSNAHINFVGRPEGRDAVNRGQYRRLRR